MRVLGTLISLLHLHQTFFQAFRLWNQLPSIKEGKKEENLKEREGKRRKEKEKKKREEREEKRGKRGKERKGEKESTIAKRLSKPLTFVGTFVNF